jgi:hypothetical protein
VIARVYEAKGIFDLTTRQGSLKNDLVLSTRWDYRRRETKFVPKTKLEKREVVS